MRKGEKKTPIHALVPERLELEIRLLLTDPMTGRIEYGAMSDLIEALLKIWLESKRKEKDISDE